MEKPFVVKEDKHYVVLYKPGKMHCAPLKKDEENTLLDFCSRLFPEVLIPQGKKKVEGGLIHRLDYETQGLVLFARNQESMNHFLLQQDEGKFLKQYEAQVSEQKILLEGFPPLRKEDYSSGEIKSAFRAYGPGRKAVRPVLIDDLPMHKDIAFDNDAEYVTRILDWQKEDDDTCKVKVELFRGFRHQIRSHLAWIGFPILNDSLYGGEKTSGSELALKAVSLSFSDPETLEAVKVSL